MSNHFTTTEDVRRIVREEIADYGAGLVDKLGEREARWVEGRDAIVHRIEKNEGRIEDNRDFGARITTLEEEIKHRLTVKQLLSGAVPVLTILIAAVSAAFAILM